MIRLVVVLRLRSDNPGEAEFTNVSQVAASGRKREITNTVIKSLPTNTAPSVFLTSYDDILSEL